MPNIKKKKKKKKENNVRPVTVIGQWELSHERERKGKKEKQCRHLKHLSPGVCLNFVCFMHGNLTLFFP
jgi:hypothetical protein